MTVPLQDLKKQLCYLQQQGYTSILLSDLVGHIRKGTALPDKPVLITFDDGYLDNFTNAYPLFVQLGMKANIFLVPAFLGSESYLSIAEIRMMDPAVVEYGLHSYDHKSYKTLGPDEIRHDLVQCVNALIRKGVAFQPCLAFPYGAYPKKGTAAAAFAEALAAENIVAAFRIGNRLNPLPLRNSLLIQRLDIHGRNNFKKFTRLLNHGKRWFGYL